MPEAPAPIEELLLAEFPKNSREVVRISSRMFKGLPLLSLRVFYADGAELKPGKAGLCIRQDQLDTLRSALDQAAALLANPGAPNA